MATYDITQSSFNIANISTGDTLTCPYTGSEIPLHLRTGKYQFTIVGASGNTGNNTTTTDATYLTVGQGGTSTGTFETLEEIDIYINVGGCGEAYTGTSSSTRTGGYNGGGNASYWGGVGGGATHIATRSGLLQSLEDYKDTIIMVAGGGGGSAHYSGNSQYYGNGGAGGGTTGVAGTKSGSVNATYCGQGGTQTAGGAAGTSTTRQGQAGSFGKGGNYTAGSSSYSSSAGGGGYYGGGAGANEEAGGGGGSGYVSTTWLTNASTSQGSSAATTSNGSVTIVATKLYDEICDLNISLSGGTFYSSHSNGIIEIQREEQTETLIFAPYSSSQSVTAYINGVDVTSSLSYNSSTGRYTLSVGPFSDNAEVRIICGDVSDNFAISVTGDHADIELPNTTVYKGENFTVRFSPADTAQYRYVALYDNNVDVSASTSSSNGVYSYTISNIQEVHQLIILSEPIPTHTVTVSCGPMGTVSNLGTNEVLDGDSLTLQFNPDTNYSLYKLFVNSEAVSFSGNNYILSNIQEDMNVYALFSSGDINFYIKNSTLNEWVPVTQLYKKIDGRWVEQDFETSGNTNMKWVRGDSNNIRRVSATMRLIPSTYTLSNTSYLTISNEDNMYANTDNTTYTTITNTRTSTTSYYIYVKGFNFSDVPDNAVIDSFSIKVKGYENGVSTSVSYAPTLCNNTSIISGASTASSTFETSSKTITVPYTGTWETLLGYGSNLGIRCNVRRANRNTTSYLYIQGAEIEVNYHYYEVY